MSKPKLTKSCRDEEEEEEDSDQQTLTSMGENMKKEMLFFATIQKPENLEFYPQICEAIPSHNCSDRENGRTDGRTDR